MKKGYLLPVWITVAGLMIIASACTPSRVLVNEFNGNPTSVPTEQEQPAQPEDNSSSEVDQQPEQPPAPSSPQGGIPEDVPIIEGASNIQSSRTGDFITYQINTDIDEMVQYYQDELPNLGWEMHGPPDNAVGAIATMSRKNEAGDTLLINMQFNEIGGFVIMQITLSRVP
jgi:hypothetical protein